VKEERRKEKKKIGLPERSTERRAIWPLKSIIKKKGKASTISTSGRKRLSERNSRRKEKKKLASRISKVAVRRDIRIQGNQGRRGLHEKGRDGSPEKGRAECPQEVADVRKK